MVVVIGEVLFDVFPRHKRIGGAPLNFAFHLHHLEVPVRLVSRVGEDADGRAIRDIMQRYGLDVEGIQIDPEHVTGTVQVTLDENGVPEYEITREVAYDYLTYTDTVAAWLHRPPDLVYFGTLIQRTARGKAFMEKVCAARNPRTRFFYDVNLRPDGYTRETIRVSLRHTDILKLNESELHLIGDMLDYSGDTNALVRRLQREFKLEVVAVTSGESGSRLYFPDTVVEQKIGEADYSVVDTVGAGDAFAAVLAAGYRNGLSPQKILETATDFAGRICGISGAVPEDIGFYRSARKQLTE